MQCVETILVKPDERGKVINLTNVEKVELELVPGAAGYEYIHDRTAYVGFIVGNIEELVVFPGSGGPPGKDGQKSYVILAPNQYESITGTEGSGFPQLGRDGYVKVMLHRS
jgi:hypothetical protein